MRGLTRERLALILQSIPSGAVLTTAATGNFKIIYKGEYYGYIDVDEKKLVLAEKHNG